MIGKLARWLVAQGFLSMPAREDLWRGIDQMLMILWVAFSERLPFLKPGLARELDEGAFLIDPTTGVDLYEELIVSER